MQNFSDFICVIGAGPSGIFLTHELLSRGKKILLVESGNFESESSLLDYSDYFFETPSMLPKDVHRVGGGSNYWIGRVGEFTTLDFEKINGVRNEEWPFKKTELETYYRKCYERLLNNSTKDDEFVQSYIKHPELLSRGLRIRPIRYIDPKTFIKLLQEDIKNSNLIVLTDHLCIDIAEDEGTDCPVLVLQDIDKNYIKIMPKDVVIAGGTLQSTKLVLNSPKIMEKLSNKIVGKYLMEHLEGHVGKLTIFEKNLQLLADLSLNSERKLTNDILANYGFSLSVSEPLTNKLSLINISLEIIHLRTKYKFDPVKCDNANRIVKKIVKIFFLIERGIRGSIKRVFAYLNLKIFKKIEFSLWMKAEELPYYDSELRVNSLKRNSLVYNHKISIETSNEIRKALGILKEKIELNNLGYVKYYPEISKSKSILKMRPNWHPMGTLRIGNASNGVVNENLLVHGTKHVYVLSPAVFPTGSNQNPVFTTLALAIKLADHFV